MAIDWRTEDPGLPVHFGQCSNGEYDPEPVTVVRREMADIALTEVDRAMARTAMSRRHFLRVLRIAEAGSPEA